MELKVSDPDEYVKTLDIKIILDGIERSMLYVFEDVKEVRR